MKFKCGPTAEERIAAYNRLVNWHPYFLWWPQKIGDYCYCLQWVERIGKRMPGSWDDGPSWHWEYRVNG